MKIFDFKCGSCSHIYEVFLRRDTVPKCKECGETENQQKLLGVGHVYATNDDSPKTQRDLANYLGNGEYVKGYKRG